MKKSRHGGVPIGISSLLLTFLVLCLVSFAVLSLSAASADLSRSKSYADLTRKYYDACLDAQAWVDAVPTSESAVPEPVEGPAVQSKDFPISETQSLHVEISSVLRQAQQSGEIENEFNYVITAWQVVTDESAFALDESLPVMP